MRRPKRRGTNVRAIRGGRGVRLAAALVAAVGMTGCGLIVTQTEYKKDKEQTGAQIQVIRKQLLAHTQILANHGKSINEVRLQLRDALSGAKEAKGRSEGMAAKEKKKASPRSATARAKAGVRSGNIMYVRAVYRGLPLNYAGGYSAPRGRRLRYKLAPGTRVRVISGNRRGFTRVEVGSGRWRGKKMWVRTRWLVPARPRRGRG